MPISNPENHVPLMFQAQTKGRCQLQFIDANKNQQDSEKWASQWTQEVYPNLTIESAHIQTRTYKIGWRFVTNGGQDDGIIRPAIGAFGWPLYPGSSMKGAFLQACKELAPAQVENYCGSADRPGILRFHGGYPIDIKWKENLVDIVHPQQGWQMKVHDTQDKPSGESGYALISLYQPVIQFGISTTQPAQTNWEEIWKVSEKAIGFGLGCRVSAGYGLPKTRIEENNQEKRVSIQGELLFKGYLEGQGQASCLIDETSEFRPNMFRGALRGHALRIFGGLTDSNNAENLVEILFGGVRNSGTVGLLAMAWQESSLTIGTFSDGYDESTYKVKGALSWLLTQKLSDEETEVLKKLVTSLMRFSMLLGGFGKSWRRADHRLFYEEYYQRNAIKPLIGCHWKWDEKSLLQSAKVRTLQHVTPFINQVRESACEWMKLRAIPHNQNYADWREAWHNDNVQVWGREATEGKEDCEFIQWLHRPYQRQDRIAGIPERSIYRSSLTGKNVGQISRLWHRMYPVVKLTPDPDNPQKRQPRKTNKFLEILTIFPDDETTTNDFLNFLNSLATDFQKLWSL